MTTEIDLEALGKLLEEATPGPWRASKSPYAVASIYIQSRHVRRENATGRWADVGVCNANNYDNPANAALIVALANAAPALLAQASMVKGLRETTEAMEAEVVRLKTIIETALNYNGPKWSDEMSLREKLIHLYTGRLNWPVTQEPR